MFGLSGLSGELRSAGMCIGRIGLINLPEARQFAAGSGSFAAESVISRQVPAS